MLQTDGDNVKRQSRWQQTCSVMLRNDSEATVGPSSAAAVHPLPRRIPLANAGSQTGKETERGGRGEIGAKQQLNAEKGKKWRRGKGKIN